MFKNKWFGDFQKIGTLVQPKTWLVYLWRDAGISGVFVLSIIDGFGPLVKGALLEWGDLPFLIKIFFSRIDWKQCGRRVE